MTFMVQIRCNKRIAGVCEDLVGTPLPAVEGVSQARIAARERGWIVHNQGYATCPRCA